MTMCILLKSCCCGSLEKGCKIIAIMEMVLGIGGLVAMLVQLGITGNALEMTSLAGILPGFVVSCMLLHGVKTGKPAFLVCWLVLKMIYIVLACVAVVVLGGFAAVYGSHQNSYSRSIVIIYGITAPVILISCAAKDEVRVARWI